MRLVQEPVKPPHVCAVIPGRGMSSEPRGFIDTENDLPGFDPHIYCSVEAVEQLGELVGMMRAAHREILVEQLDKATARQAELEGEVSELSEALDAMTTVKNRKQRKKDKVAA